MKKIFLTLTLLLYTVKLNAQVSIDWQKCLGGSGGDGLQTMLQAADGGYILSGTTTSNDGDVSVNYGWSRCLGFKNKRNRFDSMAKMFGWFSK